MGCAERGEAPAPVLSLTKGRESEGVPQEYRPKGGGWEKCIQRF